MLNDNASYGTSCLLIFDIFSHMFDVTIPQALLIIILVYTGDLPDLKSLNSTKI